MKSKTILVCSLFLLFAAGHAQAKIPHGIAGFMLGENISRYQDRLKMDTTLPIRHAEFLKEVEIQPVPGYKSGVIVYGDCANPGKIVRIKLKYLNPREEFFKELLEKYKQRFGKPDKWRGDPFHVVISWKWSFTDKSGNRIGMILQHNSEDSSKKLGNVVKLYLYSVEEEEFECFMDKYSRDNDQQTDIGPNYEKEVEWDQLVPR